MRAKPTNGEVWVERQANLRGGPRLVELAKPRQGGSNAKMPYGIVAIELYAAAQPNHSFKVCVEVHFRNPDKMYPPEGSGIPSGEPKRFPDVSFGFLRTPHVNVGTADPPSRCRHVSA